MKKFFVLLLCFLTVFVIVACKQDLNQEENQELESEDDDSIVYVLTATATGDRFQFKWDVIANTGGKVFSLKYKTDKTVTAVTTRDPSGSKYIDNGGIGAYISEADANGWVTFTCIIPEGEHVGFGIAFFATDIAANDVFKVKDITLWDAEDEEEEELTLTQANKWAGCEPTITIEE